MSTFISCVVFNGIDLFIKLFDFESLSPPWKTPVMTWVKSIQEENQLTEPCEVESVWYKLW